MLVQAPAGSGKTTLLAQRYLRLLGRVEAPECILALTFTRRAAEEMRARVVLALQSARARECPAGVTAQTWALAVAAVRHMDRLGIDPAQHPARLGIQTIDAFNSRLAAQLPIGSGLGARPRLLEDARSLYVEAARRALAYDGEDAFGAAVERVLALDDQRWRNLVGLIGDMLPSRDRWLPLLAGDLEAGRAMEGDELQRVRREFDEDLGFLVRRSLQSAAHALGPERLEACSRLVAGAAARLGEARADLARWREHAGPLRAEPADLERWRAMLSLVLVGNGDIRSRVTKAEGFAPDCADKPAFQDLLTELARDPRIAPVLRDAAVLPDAAYGDADWMRVRDVSQVLLLAAVELERVSREVGAVDFPAVAMAARRALGSPERPTDLALSLDYRLQHILVDEFQDTSAAQLALLRILTAGWQPGDGRSVFCVGDPMQSIYRFRQAEVRAFLDLAEEGIGAVRFDRQLLSSNFRTAKPLVDWVNAVFARILPDVDDRDRGAIAYRPSVSARGHASDVPVGATFAGFADRDAEAHGVADLVGVRLAENPDWKIAILVRAKAHARAIGKALRERGIAFGAVDIEPLRDHAIVRDLLALARALLHLGDRTAWLAVLRAPWIGLELSDLLVIAGGGTIVWESLRDAATLARLSAGGAARCVRLCGLLEDAFRRRDEVPFVRWLERVWLGLGGPECARGEAELSYARMAFARLCAIEQNGLPDPAEFGDAFDDLFARDGASGRVEIMTIHKAKGLEFDLVILPSLDRAVAAHNEEFLLSMQFSRATREGLVMAARPAIGAEDGALFGFLRSQARQAAQLEAQRLLYVACTRAKWQLHLTAIIGGYGERGPWIPRAGSLLQILWPVVGAEFTACTPIAGGAGATDGASDPLRGGPLRRVPLGWSPIPAPIAFELTRDPAGIQTRVETPLFDWVGETARQLGILVHGELQKLRLHPEGSAAIAARAPQFRHWLEMRGVPTGHLYEAGERVAAALTAVQEDPRGRWIFGDGHREDLREHALSGVLDGELVHIVIDRSFIDEQGRRWVIDFKTSQHSGGGLEEFLDEEVDRYRAQMQRYAAFARRLGPEPIRLGLYFPLMRAWREWAA